MNAGTAAAIELEALVTNKMLSKDIAKLSGEHQTFRVEAFHSFVNHFAPKMYVYSYMSMQYRYLLLSITVQVTL